MFFYLGVTVTACISYTSFPNVEYADIFYSKNYDPSDAMFLLLWDSCTLASKLTTLPFLFNAAKLTTMSFLFSAVPRLISFA